MSVEKCALCGMRIDCECRLFVCGPLVVFVNKRKRKAPATPPKPAAASSGGAS